MQNNNIKYTINDAKLEAEKRGGVLVSTKYQNNKNKLVWRCKYGHEFKIALYNVMCKNTWCPTCKNFYTGEEICRKFLEDVFQKSFPKYRANWLKNRNGKKLELDGYCQELGIAFEHQGIQHYKPIKHFGGKNRFNKTQQNDIDKYKTCIQKRIKIIYIPQLFTITPLSSFKDVILKQLIKNNIEVPSNFFTTKIDIKTISTNEYCLNQLNLAKNLAKNLGGKCLANNFIHSHELIQWTCKENHLFKLSFTSVKSGYWCKFCKYNERKKNFSHITKELLYNYHCINKFSITKISKILKVSPQTIENLCKLYNITITKQTKNKMFLFDEMYDLYVVKKLSLTEIGKIYNVSRETIKNKLLKLDIPIRKPNVLSINLLVKLYKEDNMTIKEISKQFDIKENTAKQMLSRAKVRKNSAVNISENELRKDYLDNKMTMQQIANKYNCSYSKIHLKIKQFNIIVKKKH